MVAVAHFGDNDAIHDLRCVQELGVSSYMAMVDLGSLRVGHGRVGYPLLCHLVKLILAQEGKDSSLFPGLPAAV